jgi:hypothetical protein
VKNSFGRRISPILAKLLRGPGVQVKTGSGCSYSHALPVASHIARLRDVIKMEFHNTRED